MARRSVRVSLLISAAVIAAAGMSIAVAQNAPPAGGGGAGAAPGGGGGPGAGGGFGGGGGRGFGGGGVGFGGGGFGGGGGGGGGRGRGRGQGPPPRPNPLPAFYDPSLPLDQRLNDLMSKLTRQEKIQQLQMAAPAIPELGIASYDWWSEALHGVANSGNATVFPEPIGMASSFDTAMELRIAKVIGLEGRAKHDAILANGGNSGRFQGIDFWSPNVNIFRDPRWGRGQETYGEDPYLTGRMAIQFVHGLQGDDPFYYQVIATPKHFAVHSGPEQYRHFFDAVITDQDLFTTYLPAFEAAIREGKADSIMSSYNAIDGVPSPANHRLLTDILRDQWGFKGYVVSDVDSVGDVWQNHRFVPDAAAASVAAIRAGNDLNSGTTYAALTTAPESLISDSELDVSVRRLFEARFRLGEFDPAGYAKNPYNKITPQDNDLPASDATALAMARETMTLLKNENHTLPLKKNMTIAVLGPNANNVSMQYGNYNGTSAHPISILQGIQTVVGADHVFSAPQDAQPVPTTTERVALTEPIKSEYLFTDVTRQTHGLTATYSNSITSTDPPVTIRDDATLDFKMPEAPTPTEGTRGRGYAPLPYVNGAYVKWTGVLVPPTTGDYQIGIKGRDSFRMFINGVLVLDEWSQNAPRVAGNAMHFEKDKAYDISIEYMRPAPGAGGGAGGGRGGRGGRGGGGGGGRGGAGGFGGFGGGGPAGAPGAAPGGALAAGGGAPGGGAGAGGFGGGAGPGGFGGGFGGGAPGAGGAPGGGGAGGGGFAGGGPGGGGGFGGGAPGAGGAPGGGGAGGGGAFGGGGFGGGGGGFAGGGGRGGRGGFGGGFGRGGRGGGPPFGSSTDAPAIAFNDPATPPAPPAAAGGGFGGGGGGFGGGGAGGFGGGGGFGPGAGAPDAAGGATTPPATAPAATQPQGDTTLVELVWTQPTADGAAANTSGKELYADEINLAKKADAVVLVLGINSNLEREQNGVHSVGFDGGDRTAIELPAVQEELLEQVTQAVPGKPVILVLTSGSALAVPWARDHVPAIMEAWYPGQHGDAVADVLFGNYNPAGRLPVTMYTSTADLPPFTDYSMANRTYRYYNGPVLYPFGYGLSYSTFQYSNLKAPSQAQTGADIKVSADVKNTSGVAGDEVVECYINRSVPPVDPGTIPVGQTMTAEQATQAAIPHKQLVGFQRVPLKPGETKTVTFTLTPYQLSIVGPDSKWIERPGGMTIQVGGTSVIGPGVLSQPLSIGGSEKAPEYRFAAPGVQAAD